MAQQLVRKASNVSDATVQKHIRAVAGLRELLETANGNYRSALKAAKNDGINTKELIAAMAAKKREVDDVHGDLRDYVRYLAMFNMPVEQLDLFGGTPATADGELSETDTTAPVDDHAEWEATDAGILAGKAGVDKTTNPFPPSDLHDAWHGGWMKGQATLVENGGVKKASPRKNRSKDAPDLTAPIRLDS